MAASLGSLVKVERSVEEQFPGIKLFLRIIRGVSVKEFSEELEKLKEDVVREVRGRFSAEELKDQPVVKAYRSFFWKIGVDPTKVRPAGEALIRRTLVGKPAPRVNTLVDAYNLASMKTSVALAAFDLSKIKLPLTLRFSKPGEIFRGIGMDRARELRGGEVVVSDEEKLVAIYPYRDSDDTKVTMSTRDVALLTCGVPGLREAVLIEAEELAIRYITMFCGGSLSERWVAP
ncbi:MAG: phenylalanine--tRNA ligase beta subunit-related protein [Candidatus Nezhaarchaeota archaeon]|nr:phenylalanine--tRNA ligase beta subunit-related protein [Candidatus Nezhaarchaeota archaeon]